MAEYYRGPVAFGFDPPDCFWTDPNKFEKFVTSCFNQQDPEGADHTAYYEGAGFKLADHRDTAGCYGRADSVEEFVNDNLDMSTMEDSTVLDTYIIVNEARLVVKILSSDADIAELKNWEFSPYETMSLERVDAVGDDVYEVIYKIDSFNRESIKEILGEAKKPAGNKLTEAAARASLAPELKDFVRRFVGGMAEASPDTLPEGDFVEREDAYYDALAEHAYDCCKYSGFPDAAVKWLPWILSEDCLNCNLAKLSNALEKYMRNRG